MKNFNRSNQQKGFTLVEMAIVLVIIGLIVASITVSKDTMRAAEYNKVWTKFISPWSQAAYDYFQRTGSVPSCGTAAACLTAMSNVGISMPSTYGVTNAQGVASTMTIASIADQRTGNGGMLVTYTAVPEPLAYAIDRIADSDHDATGTKGQGLAAGDVQWTAATNGTLTIRLRDITGAGSG